MADSRNRPSPDPRHPVEAAVEAAATELAGRDLAVGFSGGRDSVCLLHALQRLRQRQAFRLRAVHIHHGLSPQADDWSSHCEQFAASLDVPFELHRVTVEQGSGQGTEAAARQARYQVFAALPVDAIVLAHHRGDQAETLLLNLLRGAGVHGAAGMPVVRSLHRARASASPILLLRPLLGVGRPDIEAYLAQHGLPYVDDESNSETHFRRNFLRREIVPRLAPRFPAAEERLAAAARRFGEAAGLLDELAQIDLASLARAGGLDCESLARLSSARQRNLLRCWLAQHGEQADTESIEELRRQASSPRADSAARIALEHHVAHVWRGRLRLDEQQQVVPAGPLAWGGEAELPWAGGMVRFERRLGEGLSLARIAGLELRPRQGGETLRCSADGHRRTVKKLLQERGIPPWQRSRLPFVWGSDELLCVPGLGVAAAFVAQPQEMGLSVEWAADAG